MGQTLTHGVYLPSEGERNCYSGLASNWRLLDGAIGTVAAHTTAIAEKAPLVHTHSKSDITDFPAYGTTAGTICEGNDSRLSDARTPVAHTHTKSDVTDLLNSNFIPGANNSYDLGSSSYQWNNLYAKNYYYNGVAWGLDKANVWSTNNSFYGITIYGNQTNTFQSNSSVGEKGDASIFALNIQVQDKNHAGWASSGVANIGMGQDQNGSYMSFALETIDSNNTRRNNALSFLLKPTDNSHDASFFPNRNNTVELGTSTHKWKSLNGLNPGALSLPNINYTEGNPDVYNVGTDLNNLTKNVSDPLHFSWTSPFDGWLAIMWYLNGIQPPYNVLVTTGDSRFSKFSQTWSASSERWYLATTFPVLKNVTYYFDIDFQNTTIGVVHHAYLLPCLGNV